MLIKEYRIALPLSVEEYRIAQLYMIQKKSREESEGTESGVEILENRPYTDGPHGSGQYTYKVYHIGRHLPSWFRGMAPKTALEVHEESWNAYPYTKTKFSVPFVDKFTLEVDTVFQPDAGTQDNIFNLSRSELRQRELDVIDIVTDSLSGSDYKLQEDPRYYQSVKTGRGPLGEDWKENPPNGVIMCSYKLIKVEFRYWGLQSRIERFIHDYGLRRVMLRAHRQAWAWQDEWVGLTIEDIRQLEKETQLILRRKLGKEVVEEEEEKAKEMEDKEEEIDVVPEMEVKHEEAAAVKTMERGAKWSLRRGSMRPSLTLSNMDTNEDNEEYWQCALDTIALHSDESDTEYFDAKDTVSSDDEDEEGIESSQQSLAPSSPIPIPPRHGADITETPISFVEDYHEEPVVYRTQGLSSDLHGGSSIAPSTDYLILLVHGGSVLQSGHDSVSQQIDLHTVSQVMEEVITTHYQYAAGRVAVRLVPCPNICSQAMDILCSISPSQVTPQQCGVGMLPEYKEASSPSKKNRRVPEVTPSDGSCRAFPIDMLPLLATESSRYSSQLAEVAITANTIYQEFLNSAEGKCFNGQVCIIADCLGSLLVYDILTTTMKRSSSSSSSLSSSLPSSPSVSPRSSEHLPPGAALSTTAPPLSSPLTSRKKPNVTLSSRSGSSDDAGRRSPLLHSETVDEVEDDDHHQTAFFSFNVSRVFACGSPLGLVLAARKNRRGKISKPFCGSFYNLFYNVDPLARRLEPLLDSHFSTLSPVFIPLYHKYPTGDNISILLQDTVVQHPHLFGSSHQLLTPTWRSGRGSSPQKYASIDCLVSSEDQQGTEDIGIKPFSVWWSPNRIDYILDAPPELSCLGSLPNSTFAHVVQSRYWEAKEISSFILRQILQRGHPRSKGSPLLIPFVPPTSTVKWTKRKTFIRIQRMSPNHRAMDAVTTTHTSQPPLLQAKFFYGPLDMVSLSGEMVDVYTQVPSSQTESQREWQLLNTVTTDKHGRITYTHVSEQSHPPGIYPTTFLVKGDHTTCSCNLFVIPPYTEAVVFSIDGAFTNSFSLSARDMKVKQGSVDIARLWQSLGYLIVYITGRPNIQKQYVSSWLGLHGFPVGVLSLSESLSADSQAIKKAYLMRLMKEAKVIFRAAYGSQRHLSLYKELGLQPDQVYIHGRGKPRKSAGGGSSSEGKGTTIEEDCQYLVDGFESHLGDLRSSMPRQAAIDINAVMGTLNFPGAKDDAGKSSGRKSRRHFRSKGTAPSSQGLSAPTLRVHKVTTESD